MASGCHRSGSPLACRWQGAFVSHQGNSRTLSGMEIGRGVCRLGVGADVDHHSLLSAQGIDQSQLGRGMSLTGWQDIGPAYHKETFHACTGFGGPQLISSDSAGTVLKHPRFCSRYNIGKSCSGRVDPPMLHTSNTTLVVKLQGQVLQAHEMCLASYHWLYIKRRQASGRAVCDIPGICVP